MIYGCHYDPDNYMLPYGRPLVHVAQEKERERIGRWYPACWPTIHNMLCARKTVWTRPKAQTPSDCFDRFDTLWYFVRANMGSPSKSRRAKLPRKEKNCADSNRATMPAIWWRLVILRYAMMLATDDYALRGFFLWLQGCGECWSIYFKEIFLTFFKVEFFNIR